MIQCSYYLYIRDKYKKVFGNYKDIMNLITIFNCGDLIYSAIFIFYKVRKLKKHNLVLANNR